MFDQRKMKDKKFREFFSQIEVENLFKNLFYPILREKCRNAGKYGLEKNTILVLKLKTKFVQTAVLSLEMLFTLASSD